MKAIIDIPEDVYTRFFDNGIQDNEIAADDVCEMARALRLGKPLEKHDEEIIKETVASIWGKPCADAVSRQAVKNEIMCWIGSGEYRYAMSERFLFDRINELPPVYPQNTEVLDKIRAEIEQYQADCDLSCSDDANCRICDRITFDTIYRIIDKYRKGHTNEDSD